MDLIKISLYVEMLMQVYNFPSHIIIILQTFCFFSIHPLKFIAIVNAPITLSDNSDKKPRLNFLIVIQIWAKNHFSDFRLY